MRKELGERDSMQGLIGKTPLIKISDRLYAKLETYSPTGSVKDRMVSFVVQKAIAAGVITPNTIFCEATSGNTGIALAAAAAEFGVECVIYMPSNMSEERKQMMRVYGAKIVETSPSDFDAAILLRDQFIVSEQNAWSPMQFSNPENVECHHTITAPEIDSQVTAAGLVWGAFVHGSGTGGTIEGVRRYTQGTVKMCMVVPKEKLHGIQGIGDGRNFLADPHDMDEVITVSTDDAIERAKKFARETGLLIGISSGANIVAAERLNIVSQHHGVTVTMLCDRGERYMSVY